MLSSVKGIVGIKRGRAACNEENGPWSQTAQVSLLIYKVGVIVTPRGVVVRIK